MGVGRGLTILHHKSEFCEMLERAFELGKKVTTGDWRRLHNAVC